VYDELKAWGELVSAPAPPAVPPAPLPVVPLPPVVIAVPPATPPAIPPVSPPSSDPTSTRYSTFALAEAARVALAGSSPAYIEVVKYTDGQYGIWPNLPIFGGAVVVTS
jgi:hypothetical protein